MGWMGLLQLVVGWATISIVVTTLVGIGVGLMSTTPPEFTAAKICFSLAAGFLLFRAALSLASAQMAIVGRLGLAFVIFGLIGVSWVGAFRWVAVRQESRVAAPHAPQPILRVASLLEPDTEHKVFRLSVWNDGEGIANPTATLERLNAGEQTHETVTPFELDWMHSKQQLSHREQGKVNVVYVDIKKDILIFGNRVYLRHAKIHSTTGDIIGASFCIRVALPGTTVLQERGFRLFPDDSQPLLYRAEYSGESC